MTTMLNRFLFLLCLAAIAAPGFCAELPTQIHAVYRVYRSGLLIGHDEENFERQGDKYRIVSHVEAEGIASLFVRGRFSMTSEGRIVGDEFLPQVFTSARGSPPKTLTAKFDWERKQIESSREDVKEYFDLPTGTQDRLTAMYQYMLRAPTTDIVVAWMTQGKRVEPYRYLKQGETVIRTTAGDFNTVYFARDTKDTKTKVQLWLAKDRLYLPVRIIFEDKNGKFEQQLVDLTIR